MKQISVKANGSLLHEAMGYKYEILFCILKNLLCKPTLTERACSVLD